MCGLYGVIGPAPRKLETFVGLGIANMSRGSHSTGYADIFAKTNEIFVRKGAVKAKDFIPWFRHAKGDVLIGHTRHATCGKVNTQNAHPWKIGRVVGAHNGIVTNEHEVKTYLSQVHNDHARYEVDSQYLLHMVAHYGHMGVADGMLNLTYWDTKTRSMNFIVCDNPLALAISKDNKWAVWSSDFNHLEAIIKATGLFDDTKIHKMHQETLELRFQNDILIAESGEVPFDKDHKKKKPVYSTSSTYSNSDNWADYHQRTDKQKMLGQKFPGTDGSSWEMTEQGWVKEERNGIRTLVLPEVVEEAPFVGRAWGVD